MALAQGHAHQVHGLTQLAPKFQGALVARSIPGAGLTISPASLESLRAERHWSPPRTDHETAKQHLRRLQDLLKES